MSIKTVSFVGAGNVANHLAKAFFEKGIKICQILNRSLDSANELAEKVDADALTDFNNLKEVDCVIVATPDDTIPGIFRKLSHFNSILAHTSGINGIEFENIELKRSAYIYPLQSFKHEYKLNLSAVPFFVAAQNDKDKQYLIELVEIISSNVHQVPLDVKQKLHLSAVMLNNFVNHLFGLTYHFLKKDNIDFEYLKPIIETTIHRAIKSDPLRIQTGPAIRNDESTINKHLQLLRDFPELQSLYRELSQSIQNIHLNGRSQA